MSGGGGVCCVGEWGVGGGEVKQVMVETEVLGVKVVEKEVVAKVVVVVVVGNRWIVHAFQRSRASQLA